MTCNLNLNYASKKIALDVQNLLILFIVLTLLNLNLFCVILLNLCVLLSIPRAFSTFLDSFSFSVDIERIKHVLLREHFLVSYLFFAAKLIELEINNILSLM